MTDVLGLLSKEADIAPEEVKQLVAARTQAKKDKNFALADSLRQQVLDLGYIIEDTPSGAKIKKA
jgi:cysteinyl-tRNA synthetase